MKVLHISSGNLYGGVETVLATLARCRNVCPTMNPHFALCFSGRLSQELACTGVPVYELGGVRASRPWTVWRARKRLSDVLRSQSFDVMVCHMPWSMAMFGPVAKSSGQPLAFWAHGIPDGIHWLERWASQTAPDLAICNSQFTAAALPNIFPNTSSSVVYCPVGALDSRSSGDSRSAIRRELGVSEDVVVIVQVSRLEPWKGQLLHLEALALLQDLPAWQCWMVGGAQRKPEHTYLAQLQQRATELGIADRVRFLGQRSDVPALLAASDIHCQPNLSAEPFGITFIEALQAGLPVVTTDLGGAKEIVDESCGFLAKPADPSALAALLGRLIESPGLRRQVGSAGPSRARRLCDPAQQLAHLSQALTGMLDANATCLK